MRPNILISNSLVYGIRFTALHCQYHCFKGLQQRELTVEFAPLIDQTDRVTGREQPAHFLQHGNIDKDQQGGFQPTEISSTDWNLLFLIRIPVIPDQEL